MAQRVYATVADYEDFTEGLHEPATVGVINARLRRASVVIEGLTRLSRYDTDVDGNPTDADVSAAFTEATCAQMAWWEVTDDVSGAESTVGAVKIGSVSLGTTSSAGSSNTPAASRISPEAVEILRNAQLITSLVNHR